MTPVLVLLLLILASAVTAAVLAVVRQVRKDGYGSRPAPRSHREWDEEHRLRLL